MNQVNFKGSVCDVVLAQYFTTDNTCIRLYDAEGPVATATINMGYALPNNQAFIKDYEENSGMVEALKAAGILGELLDTVRVGYVVAPLYELNL